MSRRYDDGQVEIFNLTNTSAAGEMPVYSLVSSMGPYCFAEVSIGMNRQYLAKGVDERIDLMLQIWAESTRPRIGQIAVVKDWKFQEDATNGDQYRIDNVQMIQEEGLDVFVLTLRRLEDKYDNI